MGTKIWIAVMAVLTGLYAYLLVGRGVVLLQDDNPVAILMGLAILVFPLLALWVLFVEIRFGLALAKVGKLFGDSGMEPPSYQLRPSGRAEKESGQQVFAELSQRIEQDEDNFLLWYLLADCYDKLSDRPRARKAARKAISLAKQAKAL